MPMPIPPGDSTVRLLAESLRALADGEVEALLRFRPDLAAAEPATFEELARLAMTPASAKACYERLDEGAQQLLQAAAALGESPAISKLATGLGLGPETIEPHLRRLARLALTCFLAPEGSRILLNRGLRQFLRLPAGLGPPLANLLATTTSQKLAELCEQLGLPRRRNRTAALQDLSEALSSPSRVAAIVSGGPDGSAELAAHLAVSAEIHVEHRAGGTYQLARSQNSPVGHLLRHGALVATSGISAVAPAEVGMALRGGRLISSLRLEPPALDPQPVPAAESDAAAAGTARRFVEDLTRLLDRLGAEPARLLQGGGLGVREVRRAAKLLGRPEHETAQLVELAFAASLVGVDEEDGLVLPTAAFDAWAALPSPARWAHLAAAWLDSPLCPSIAGAIGPDGKPIPPLSGFLHPRAATRRKVVLDLLAQLGDGSGAASPSLMDRAAWQAPSCWADGPARAETLRRWVLEEAELLGLVDSGRLSSFARPILVGQLTAARDRLAELSPPLVSTVLIQADLTAVAAGELEPALRGELELLADLESAGAASVYRFSEASLRRALDAGKSPAEILSFLTERAAKGVPQALGYLIEDLGRRYGKLRLGAARSFVRCEDQHLVAELCQAKRLRRAGLRAVAPTVAVSRLDPGGLLGMLRDAGYLAAAEEDDGTLAVARPPSRRAPDDRGGFTSFDALDALDDLASLDTDGGEALIDTLVARLRLPKPPEQQAAKRKRALRRSGAGPTQLGLLEEMLEALLDGSLEEAR